MSVYTTNPIHIKFLECNPNNPIIIGFEGCNLVIKDGSNVLNQISLCDIKLESLGLGDNLQNIGCGGFVSKKIILKSKENYILTASEISQSHGGVQMIVVKVKYPKEQPPEDRYLIWKYKEEGEEEGYPLGEFMVLTGKTKFDSLWQGWDLNSSSLGGILFSNPSNYDVNIEIFVFN